MTRTLKKGYTYVSVSISPQLPTDKVDSGYSRKLIEKKKQNKRTGVSL